jgi:hypothetical protein
LKPALLACKQWALNYKDGARVVKQKIKQAKQWVSKKRTAYVEARPHRSFKRTKKARNQPPMASIKSILRGSLATIKANKGLFFGLAFVYMAVTYIFIGGIAQSDFVDLKKATVDVFGGNISSINTVFSLLTSTMSGAFDSNLTELQQFLALLISMMFWLTLVWALRMRSADQSIKIRDALYNAGAPLVAYIIILLVIMLQLTPGVIGIFVFSTAQNGSYLQGGVELMLFAAAAFLLCCLSVYWLAGSLLSLVIVTLPNMYPFRALSIASNLVVGRRLRLLAHTVALIVALFALWVVVLLPTLLIDSWLRLDWLPLVPIMVQALGALSIIYAATYIYKLYRSLL